MRNIHFVFGKALLFASVLMILLSGCVSQKKIRYLQQADEKDTIFIPGILNGIITNPSLKSDFLHPNAKGYKIIAQKIYRDILPYLKQNKQLLEKKKEKVFIRQQ